MVPSLLEFNEESSGSDSGGNEMKMKIANYVKDIRILRRRSHHRLRLRALLWIHIVVSWHAPSSHFANGSLQCWAINWNEMKVFIFILPNLSLEVVQYSWAADHSTAPRDWNSLPIVSIPITQSDRVVRFQVWLSFEIWNVAYYIITVSYHIVFWHTVDRNRKRLGWNSKNKTVRNNNAVTWDGIILWY
jgi:hypothetical protein